MATPSEGLDAEGGRPQHDHEAADPDDRLLLSDPEYEHSEPEHHGDRRDDDPPPRMEPRIGGANCRGEFRILGQRPLDLIEQPLLMLGQRHGVPPGDPGRRDGPADR